MEVIYFLGLIACIITIVCCTTALEKRLNNLERKTDINYDVISRKYKDLYNDNKELESRILKLKRIINKLKNKK